MIVSHKHGTGFVQKIKFTYPANFDLAPLPLIAQRLRRTSPHLARSQGERRAMAVVRQLRSRDIPAQETERKGIDELLREIVGQVNQAESPTLVTLPDCENEEILIDAEVDGARYLLIRLPEPRPLLIALSPREQEIGRMVAKGYCNKTIAGVLNISTWTVCTHLRRSFAKLGVTSRAAMVARLMEERRP
jgi:DNA-binding CsgD family transcriptional regulator